MITISNWFSVLKKNEGWTGELSDTKKGLLKATPKMKVDIPKFDYPDNEKEIPAVLAAMKNKKLKPAEMKETDVNARDMFFDLVDDEEEDYSDLIKDLEIYTIREKVRYNRARPYQVSDKIEKPKTHTIDTPSFPSGHSIESFGIAVALAHKFPDKKKALMDVAEKVSDARVEMGVHYPSDKKVGKQIGEMIGKVYIKEVMS